MVRWDSRYRSNECQVADVIKRILDLSLCLIALPILLPVLGICALAVRLTSSGPVMFRQPRLGKDGQIFSMYKFRSMYVNAPDVRNADGSTYNGVDDPRVTPAGRFLRATSLDELPQLFNIIQGHMSIVGPRPDILDITSTYEPRDYQRLWVKPGLTGLAQVNGRNSIPVRMRREFDIEYATTQSIWLDLKILARTVPMVLRRTGVFYKKSGNSDAQHSQDAAGL